MTAVYDRIINATSYAHHAGVVDIYSEARNAISEKANKYGILPGPYIIAVNLSDYFTRMPQDVIGSLYGSEIFEINRRTNEVSLNRRDDGSFSFNEDRRENVSGVLFINNAGATHLGGRKVFYGSNPRASHVINPFTNVPTLDINSLTITEGHALLPLLGLDENWLNEY